MLETDADFVQRARPPWVGVVTRDAIRHFAWGIGDDNPLWHDVGHAAASRWGGMVAPPSLLYAVDETTVAPGHAGFRRFYRSVEWVWFDVLYEGTVLVPVVVALGESEVDGVLRQRGRVTFEDVSGRILAIAETQCDRFAEPIQPVEDRPELRYSGSEIARIEERILSEQRQGKVPRLIENVSVGEAIGEVVKGPLSIMDVVAWCAATQGMASDADGYSDGGLHAEMATGPEQVAWITQALTDWAGDDGFVHRLSVHILANPLLGSTTTVSGVVASVSVGGGDAPSVEIEVEARSESGAVIAHGVGKVLLPSRATGPVAVPLSD